MLSKVSRRAWFGLAGATAATAALAACDATTPSSDEAATSTAPSFTPREPITDPDAALEALKRGNQRFVEAEQEHPGQHPDARVAVAGGQSPFAVIVSCSDSRVPPELLVDQGFGDLFVVRVAGNVIGTSELGSVEYAVEHLHTPLIVTVGHARCGAVDAAVAAAEDNSVPEGAIGEIVTLITPAVKQAQADPGDDLLDTAIRRNAELSRDTLLKSKVVSDAVAAGKLNVIAVYYSLDDDGQLEML